MIRIQPLFLKVGIESYDFEARIQNHQIEKSDFNSISIAFEIKVETRPVT